MAASLSALVTGATGSMHCALMCGPLACAAMGRARSTAAVLAWHGGRLGAYVLVGAALGALGRGVSAVMVASVQRFLPWVMAAGLLIAAFDLSKRLGPLPLVGKLALPLGRLAGQSSPGARGFLLGVATPLLPCGLLYGLFLASIATADAAHGALLLGSFALGAVPALLAVQLGLQRLSVSPQAVFVVRRLVPVAAAAVLIVRAVLARNEVGACG